ncbi:MAG: DUF3187 family protein [Leptospiraceae bacterium]|nr:DUF3187 family protein [Leptospiraceae bacterium]
MITLRPTLLPVWYPNRDFFSLGISLKNIWSHQYERFTIDGEEFEFLLHTHKVVKKHFFGIKISFKNQSGGFLDHSIETFHQILGITQQHRKKFPKNKLQISYEPLGGLYQFYDYYPIIKNIRRSYPRLYPRKSFDPPKLIPLEIIPWKNRSYVRFENFFLPLEVIHRESQEFSAFDNPIFYYYFELFESSRRKLYIGSNVKIPAKNQFNYFYSAGWDGNIFLSILQSYSKGEFLVGISYNYYEYSKFEDLQISKHQWSIRIQGNFNNENKNYFLEYVFFSKPIINMGRLAEDGHFLAIGKKINNSSYTTTLAIIENFYRYAISPDIGIYISFEVPMNT